MDSPDEVIMDRQFQPPTDYTTKFAGFIQACQEAKDAGAETLVIAQPWVIGDTYEEIIESLSRLADAGLSLTIVQRA